MRKIVWVLLACFAGAVPAIAQDAWNICLGKKVLISGEVGVSDTTIALNRQILENARQLMLDINYTTGEPTTGWNRTFYFTNSKDKELQTLDLPSQSGQVRVRVNTLLQAFAPGETMYLYTTSLPADKAKAAMVKVRRVLVCKIEWK